MHATSTPQLAQSKPNVFGAFLAAAALAIAIVVGVAISVSLAPTTVDTPAPAGAAILPDNGALRITRAGEIGAATAAERSLAEQRKGEINAGAAVGGSDAKSGTLTPAQREILEHRQPGDPWAGELMPGAAVVPGVAVNNMSDAAADAMATFNSIGKSGVGADASDQFRGDRGYWRNHAQELPARVTHSGARAKAE
jgi:hypothetical protein